MAKFKAIFWIAILLAIFAAFAFRVQIADYFSPQIQKAEKAVLNAALQEIKKQLPVSLPEPLKVKPTGTTKPASATSIPAITVSGTIKWTNIQRSENDLPPFSHNSVLDEIAAIRAKDMFEKQYFAHIAPDGSGAESVAAGVGYDYLALGENLALGIFKSDEDLVLAWMNSPGHRANILNTHYTEIGVAAKKGFFEGDYVWIAVQIFGKPASACPAVDKSLKPQIEAGENQLNLLQTQLAAKKQEVESAKSREEYKQKTEEYNALVVQYNNLLDQTKILINNYNSQVSVYNQCIAS